MKLFSVFMSLLLASASFADTYKCAEKADAALKENRLQYSVILVEVSEIKDPAIVAENDGARYVRVSILSRDPEAGGRFELDRPSFEAIATYADVLYVIDAKTSNGFTFHMYMDEADQTSMTIKGVKKSIRLNCTFEPNH